MHMQDLDLCGPEVSLTYWLSGCDCRLTCAVGERLCIVLWYFFSERPTLCMLTLVLLVIYLLLEETMLIFSI